jgi:DNA-binding XRE family transcriptional regulator
MQKTAHLEGRPKQTDRSPARWQQQRTAPTQARGYFCPDMKIEQKKDYAQLLYVKERMTQKEVAARADVSEQTMSKWVRENGWDKLRKSLLVTKQEQIAVLYDQLETLTALAKEREVKILTNKEADLLIKYTNSIKALETELSLGEMVETLMRLCDHVRANAPEQAGEVVALCDGFIKINMAR